MRGRKLWTASDSAEMAVLTGRGWSDARIGRHLGFARETVTRQRRAFQIEPNRVNYWTAPLMRAARMTAQAA